MSVGALMCAAPRNLSYIDERELAAERRHTSPTAFFCVKIRGLSEGRWKH